MTERPRIITLTLSPARDLTIEADTIDLGTSHRVPQAKGRLGGKGINVARVLAALGRSVYVQGPVNAVDWPESADSVSESPDAKSAGAEVPAQAATDLGAGMVWDLTATPSPLRRSYALVEESGRATLFNEQASEHPAEVWAQLEAKLRARLAEPQVSALAISGSTPSDLPEGFFERAIASAHEAGVRVIVDTSGPALIAAARAGADWLKPNHEELAELVTDGAGEPIADGDGELVTEGADRLIAAGASTVLVSHGGEGMVLIDRTGARSRARLDTPVQGNPTGAGDAVVAALLNRLTQDDAGTDALLTDAEVETILTDAVAISAAAVLMPQAGAIHPTWAELRDRVQIIAPNDAPAPTSAPARDDAAAPNGEPASPAKSAIDPVAQASTSESPGE
jgi:fructose-1-phosphate kinase PfkB-like protein